MPFFSLFALVVLFVLVSLPPAFCFLLDYLKTFNILLNGL